MTDVSRAERCRVWSATAPAEATLPVTSSKRPDRLERRDHVPPQTPPLRVSADAASGPAASLGEDLAKMPEQILDRQATALRFRLSRQLDYPGRDADQRELDRIERELVRRTRTARGLDESSRSTFRGITLAGVAEVPPLPSTGVPLKIGNYRLHAHVETLEDGTKAVAYYVAYNTASKQPEYVVGPGAISEFEEAHEKLENLAAVFGRHGLRPYEAKSAQVVDHLMRRGFSDAAADLADANRAALQDPMFWTGLAINIVTSIAAVEAPRARGARTPAPRGVEAPRARNYQPTAKPDARLRPGEGATDKFGNVTYSPHGTPKQIALAKAHESVHSWLSPKRLNGLRELRADVGMTAYDKSALCRYIEEALAESYAQVKVNGIRALPEGLKFPVANGYCTLSAVAKEGAIGTVVYAGVVYAVHLVLEKP